MSNTSIQLQVATIESLDQEGRGVAHRDGKVVFIEGAITGERVAYQTLHKKSSYELARLEQVIQPSFMRTQPRCRHFGMCGGCSMQHLEANAQVAVKQRILEDNLQRIGKVKTERMLPPIHGETWGYRQRARLSVRHVLKKGKTLVGFHEKNSRYVADLQHCEILPPKIGHMLIELGRLCDKLTIREQLPQIELASGDQVDVLVLRILKPLAAEDEALLKQFADSHKIQFWLQTKGPETAKPFYPLDAPGLSYSLPEFDIIMPYGPTDFTQVNSTLNRLMISRAMRLLAPQQGERIADFFCGLGNFTLPIARSGASVVGVEGNESLVKRAAQNAEINGLAGTTSFHAKNLFEMTAESLASLGHFDKWLIDPPRDGGMELIKSIGEAGPSRIVYVSCNPATLARDAEVLVHVKGYAIKAAGVMNMFPHTSHVESIAVFERA